MIENSSQNDRLARLGPCAWTLRSEETSNAFRLETDGQQVAEASSLELLTEAPLPSASVGV